LHFKRDLQRYNVVMRDGGGVGLNSPLMQPPDLLRSWFCTDACLVGRCKLNAV
jgi:hypothetical protein